MLMKRTKHVLFLLVLTLFSFIASECIAQESDYNIVADAYQYENGTFKPWSNDMLRIGITTKERGLVFKVIISNGLQTDAVEIEDLKIDVAIKYGDETYHTFFKQVSISYIYLPQTEDYEVIVPVTFEHGDAIGSYTAELTYTVKNSVPKHIEPYPFQFRVVGEEQFQKEIEQKKTGPVIIIGPWEIKVEIFGGGITITVVSIALVVYLLRRRRRVE